MAIQGGNSMSVAGSARKGLKKYNNPISPAHAEYQDGHASARDEYDRQQKAKALTVGSNIKTPKASKGIKPKTTSSAPTKDQTAARVSAMQSASEIGSGENTAQGVGKAGMAAGTMMALSSNPAMLAAAPWMAGAGIALGVVGNIQAKRLATENANIAAQNAHEQEKGRQRISAAKDMISIGKNLRLL